jgi:mRNA-degrading endonuclease RelE of RelBE toxin-antitoxin system
MITVVETPVFARRAAALLTEEERKQLIDFLAANPYAGDEIVGTGGVRKVRFAAKGKGKSGGVRVIYYTIDESIPLFALLIYGKGEQADLTSEQRERVAELAKVIKGSRIKVRRGARSASLARNSSRRWKRRPTSRPVGPIRASTACTCRSGST